MWLLEVLFFHHAQMTFCPLEGTITIHTTRTKADTSHAHGAKVPVTVMLVAVMDCGWEMPRNAIIVTAAVSVSIVMVQANWSINISGC